MDIITRFESTFESDAAFSWMARYWYIGHVSSLLYGILALLISRWMKHKEAFNLRLLLVFWNLLQAAYSILSSYRIIPCYYQNYLRGGIHSSICDTYCFNFPIGIWGFLFPFAKIVELGDTLFIILRKRPLTFLHVYHHAVTLVFTWCCYSARNAMGHTFFMLNAAVHSVMYLYYTLKALRIYVPRTISMCVTIIQISQMIVGLASVTYVIYVKQYRSIACENSVKNAVFGLVLYISFFALFVRFFINAYCKRFNKSTSEVHVNGYKKTS